MTRNLAWLATVLMAILTVPCLQGQTKLDRKTSIDVTAAVPRDVYGSLARTLDCDLEFVPEAQQPVTLHLEGVTIRTALNALSEGLGYQWSVQGTKLRVVPLGSEEPAPSGIVGGVPGGVKGGVSGGVKGGVSRGESGGIVGGVSGGVRGGVDFRQRLERKTPDNFRFENASLQSVMKSLGKVADLEVEVEEPAASQQVTLDLSNRTILAAFKTIREQVGLQKPIVLVATIPGSDKKMQMKMGPPKKTDQVERVPTRP